LYQYYSTVTPCLPPADLEPIPYLILPNGNPFLYVTGCVANAIGSHINPNDPITHVIQKPGMEGKLDGLVLITLCLLLMQDIRHTHQVLNQSKDELGAISAVQAAHTANLNTMCQVAAAAPCLPPSKDSGSKGPTQNSIPPALPHARYSAVVTTPALPGPAAPQPAKKVKGKPQTRDPPPMDYDFLSGTDPVLTIKERVKIDLDRP
jgi:hypothetical protein